MGKMGSEEQEPNQVFSKYTLQKWKNQKAGGVSTVSKQEGHQHQEEKEEHLPHRLCKIFELHF